jgi:hypothetical protein
MNQPFGEGECQISLKSRIIGGYLMARVVE